MKRVFHFIVIAALAAEALVLGQGADASRILADVREALGGDKKLSAVTSLTVSGRSTRVTGETSSPPTDFEMAMLLPDKYMKKEVVAVLGPNTLSRTSGFNGGELIEAMDAPPGMGSGGMVIRMGGSSGSGGMGTQQTPEQQAEVRKNTLLANRQEFARLTLGMFAASFKGYPLTFSSAGQAESPDGKADVIEVKGEGDFAAKLFVDAKTHLPLMLSWMAKEPLRMSVGPGGVTSSSGGNGRVVAGGGATVMQSFQGGAMTPEQRDQLMKDLDQRMKDAEAQRRTVEYRIYYADYQDVGGVKMPSHIQRSIDGQPSDELALEKIKLNPKIDPKKFETVK
jgi:hypothetical protein